MNARLPETPSVEGFCWDARAGRTTIAMTRGRGRWDGWSQGGARSPHAICGPASRAAAVQLMEADGGIHTWGRAGAGSRADMMGGGGDHSRVDGLGLAEAGHGPAGAAAARAPSGRSIGRPRGDMRLDCCCCWAINCQMSRGWGGRTERGERGGRGTSSSRSAAAGSWRWVTASCTSRRPQLPRRQMTDPLSPRCLCGGGEGGGGVGVV